jgi:dihydroxyacetone kinase-like protein
MELYTIWNETSKALAARGIEAVTPMVGSFVTTQEMGGFSISLLEPTDQMLAYWCEPSDSPAFPAISLLTQEAKS